MSGGRLGEEVQSAGALDFTGDFAVQPSGNTGDATWEKLAGFGSET